MLNFHQLLWADVGPSHMQALKEYSLNSHDFAGVFQMVAYLN